MLWPPPETGDQAQLAAGDTKIVDALYRIAPPVGTEAILLIASRDRIDFRPFLSRDRLAPDPEARGVGPFDQLLDDEKVRARSAAYFSQDRLRTDAITIYVTAKDE